MKVEQALRGMTISEAHNHMVKKIIAKIKKYHADFEYCPIVYDNDRKVYGYYRTLIPNPKDCGKTLIYGAKTAEIDRVGVNGDHLLLEMTDKGITLQQDVSVDDLNCIYRHVKV